MTAPTIPATARCNARPYLHGVEAAAVVEALDAGQYGHGEITEAFERDVAAFLGVPDVVAVESGTAALHLALLTAGIGPGDEVVVPSMTFCASVQAILACGARPRFADVDPDTLCVSGRTVLDALTRDTRAVMPVLYGGRAVCLGGVVGTLAERGIVVVEDAAQAFGSRHGARKVGASGEMTCFSFGPIKSLTCGQGGAVVPRSLQDAAMLRALRMLGIVQPQAERIRSTTYTVDRPGLRYPMSALNAAIGRAQLTRFDQIEAKRQRLWRAYRDALADIHGLALVDVDVNHTVPFNCVVRVLNGRDRVFADLRGQGVGVGVHYPPNHLQPAFAPWYRPLPVTEQVAHQIMSLPFHPAMDEQAVTAVAAAVRAAVQR
ncbi:DegT/DnrJ/EryC1/StrS family aminotransferase [Peterkaempfera griseoplana]|uniref:DegT/DnrJ/EryC1/StrS family aminotransferase n=1 Tax=Peterkaempfera griseoplana TaxID=66896 RepID=UPI0006E410BF|nr:DegT/DnrJ/EryC1/StrS family aminotransferase [Peterkaempfera griseoplana]